MASPLRVHQPTQAPRVRVALPAVSHRSLVIVAQVSDAVAVITTTIGADALYSWAGGEASNPFWFGAIGILIAGILVPLLYIRQSYSFEILLKPDQFVAAVLPTWAFSMLFVVLFLFAAKISADMSRATMALTAATGPFFLYFGRCLLRSLAMCAVRNRSLRRRRAFLLHEPHFGPRDEEEFVTVVAAAPLPCGADQTCATGPIIDSIRNAAVDEVLISAKWSNYGELQPLIAELRKIALPVKLIADETASEILRRPISRLGTSIYVELQKAPLGDSERAIKRGVDVLLSTLALTALCPLFAVTALLIKLNSPGRVIFLQRRKGFNGRQFKILKFRTMTVEEDGASVIQATRGDRRVTRVGAVLRHLSLDELPQLINVLRGEMSLIGPRPHAVAHDEQYSRKVANYAFRHRVKPGITGWAQVNGLRGGDPKCRNDATKS